MINLSRELITNNILINRLINSFKNNSISNSLIFSGPEGIGKATLCFFLINKILSPLHMNNKNVSNLIYNNTHPNIKYISKEFDEKTNKLKSSISINQIRNLENFIYQSSFDNNPKFIIIDSSNDLNNNSSNSLLKILEEPKKNTFFFLITHQISSILPTIRSRCLNFNVDQPTYDEFKTILTNNLFDINNDEINILFSMSNNSPGMAISFFQHNINLFYTDIIEILINKNSISTKILNLSNDVAKFTDDEFKTFLILLKFILITISKINLGVNFDSSFSSNFFNMIVNASNKLENSITLQILEYLNDNEKDLFAYNLDKKIFCLNIFTPLSNNL